MNLIETKLQNAMEELRLARDEIKRLRAEHRECPSCEGLGAHPIDPPVRCGGCNGTGIDTGLYGGYGVNTIVEAQANNIAGKELMNDWIKLSDRRPNFKEYGFQTGKKVEVRYNDGSEEVTIYQGYGLFGNGLSMFNEVTHWRPVDE